MSSFAWRIIGSWYFGLQQYLDGYVDHLQLGPPGPAASHHFLERVRDLAGTVCGRRTYEIMPFGNKIIRIGTRRITIRGAATEPAEVGVSRWLKSVGPNATLVEAISVQR